MAKQALLRPPYIKGEIKKTENGNFLLSLFLGTLFLLFPAGTITFNYFGLEVESNLAILWILALGLAVYAETRIQPPGGINAFQIFALSIPLIGLPGLYFIGAGLDYVVSSVLFIGLMILRQVAVFIIIPRCLIKSTKDPADLILTWLIAGAAIISVATNIFYLSQGHTIFSPTRQQFSNWTHPNDAALYGGVIVLLTFIKKGMPPWLRWSLVFTGVYTVLLTQSRSVIVSVAICGAVIYLLNLIDNPRRYSLSGFIAVVALGIGVFVFGNNAIEIPAVTNIVNRTFAADDPTAGRVEIAARMIDLWRESPLFGYGFRSARMDNGYITMLLHSGLVGLLVYLSFFFAVIARGIQHYFSGDPVGKSIGRYLIVMGLFIFVRAWVESYTIIKLIDVMSNATAIAAGVAILLPVRKRRNIRPSQVFINPTPGQAANT